MEYIYDILIEGAPVYTGLSEEDFFDKLEELSIESYKTGYPEPGQVSHAIYNKEDYYGTVRQETTQA